jgi:hypothetical protein
MAGQRVLGARVEVRVLVSEHYEKWSNLAGRDTLDIDGKGSNPFFSALKIFRRSP